MKIANGRTHFYQWELNQQIELSFPCAEVHFENGTQSMALSCEVKKVDGKLLCDVPNELLQTAAQLHAYAWDAEKTYVIAHKVFVVEQRERPVNYVYTPTEIKNYELLFKQTAYARQLAEEALTEAAAASATAEEAQAIAKGRATGYVFDTVEDLDVWLAEPDHVAELVVGDNFYIRTLDVPDYWWDGAQKQPLETQKVDLSEYVKNTEYGNAQRPGVVKVAGYDTGNYGFIKANQKTNPGAFLICRASDADLDAKDNYHKPVVPRNLDYAVKRGVAYNELVMTDTEKAAACQWLGTIRVIENADSSVTAIMPSGKSRTLDLSKIEWILG